VAHRYTQRTGLTFRIIWRSATTEEYSFVEMPAQLRRLAKDLLKQTAVPFIGYPELAENRQVFH
jgi:hypothetical protein